MWRDFVASTFSAQKQEEFFIMLMMAMLAFIDDENDRDTFIFICEQYRDLMVNCAKKVLGKHYRLAEDVVQNALISIAKNMQSANRIPKAELKNFVICVVKHRAVDALRIESRQRADLIEDEVWNERIPSKAPGIMDTISSEEGYAYLKNCINSLNDNYRTVLELKLLYNLPDTEIGALLGITAKNVNVRTFRGKEKLREMLQAYREGNEG